MHELLVVGVVPSLTDVNIKADCPGSGIDGLMSSLEVRRQYRWDVLPSLFADFVTMVSTDPATTTALIRVLEESEPPVKAWSLQRRWL